MGQRCNYMKFKVRNIAFLYTGTVKYIVCLFKEDSIFHLMNPSNKPQSSIYNDEQNVRWKERK